MYNNPHKFGVIRFSRVIWFDNQKIYP